MLNSLIHNEFFLLIAGLVLLLLSGKYLVDGSVSIAYHFHLTRLVVGMTIVAFGTSSPELLVSIEAALKGFPDISVYNVVGSNISNIALVLALAAIVRGMPIKRQTIFLNWPVMMGASLLFWLFVLNRKMERWEGIVFIIAIIGFVWGSFFIARKESNRKSLEFSKPRFSILVSILMVIAAAIGLSIGADLLVTNASIIAGNFGVSERVISVSVVALGTSIPELVTSVIAAFHKESDISVGNIIGSNIFNLFCVLGITSVLTPIQINPILLSFDMYWMIGISLMLFPLMIQVKGSTLNRPRGLLLLMVYIIYLYFVFSRTPQL